MNLPQGARLELVQASRSPTVISVALNLPHSEKNARLIQKFASNTSLWELLRQFESSQGANYNFTQRGVPEMNGTGTGAGRLNYEMPVITVMPGHKEYGTFVDLQKTLSQLGFDSGSASLRLSFKNSGTPLEEAMTQISQYFKSTDAEATATSSETSAPAKTEPVVSPPTSDDVVPDATATAVDDTRQAEEADPTPMDVDQVTTTVEPSSSTADALLETSTATTSMPPPPSQEPASAPESTPSSSQPRTIQVFSAPTSSTPQAARTPFNETDYQPSVEQLRGLQASYKERSKNTRLLSDKELEDQEAARREKLAATADKGGIVRVRLPDGAIVQFPVSKSDSAAEVYAFVTACLQHKDEPFHLSYRDAKGVFAQMPRDGTRVFQDLKFSTNELLTFRWDDAASAGVRSVKSVLSEEWTRKAAPLKVEEPVVAEAPQAAGAQGQTLGGAKPKKEYSAAEKENKLKNLLGKGLFKRK